MTEALELVCLNRTLWEYAKSKKFRGGHFPVDLNRSLIRPIMQRLTIQAELSSCKDSASEIKGYEAITGLKLCDNSILEVLDKRDNIEIYDISTFAQTYANDNFFRQSQYNVATLISRPFFELYERDLSVTNMILKQVQIALAERQTIAWNIPKHKIKESQTKDSFEFMVKNRFMSPLQNEKGDIVQIISTNQSERIS